MIDWNTDLIRRYGDQGPRYTSYPTALQFHEEVTADDYWRALEQGNQARRPLSLYMHIPFCKHVCYYCACNRIVTADTTRADEYHKRLLREISMKAERVDGQRPVLQMHWGGGTPTYLSDAQMTELVYHTARQFHLLEDDRADYSVEIDPRTVDQSRIGLLRGLGFNRASLGVQDLDPRVQQAVNRVQPYEMIRDVFGWLRDFGYRSINTDLIYGLPWQSETSLARTVEQLLELRPERISLYNYAHLPARFKVQRQISEQTLPSADEKLRMFRRAGEMLDSAGYLLIGMDHFALPSDTLAQAQDSGTLHRNFQGYTLYGDADLIGFGTSAISALGDFYGQNQKSVEQWQDDIDAAALPLERGCLLNRDDLIRRDLISTLLCRMWIDLDELSERWSIDARSYFGPELMQMGRLVQDGLVEFDWKQLRLTPTGRLLARAVAMVFDSYQKDTVKRHFSRII
ncbi:oxygen-independent coproporphyrinogen III oxidase [Alcanivorax sp. 1008]|uniref:oxygen-independent coproporphyrinogen III oxidase n=1 Tax=Alcanivorax sp. 1008 TaxID=2816853 RepID=UPI001D7FA881|nr:oxygen-independent coproporphyrinogen III oxidase [Alcanivorax sp. 1008]MCC1497753.1 oxygen-independent coproporphyrinogen III oxidase [Alcanivorax sp. 1008]